MKKQRLIQVTYSTRPEVKIVHKDDCGTGICLTPYQALVLASQLVEAANNPEIDDQEAPDDDAHR